MATTSNYNEEIIEGMTGQATPSYGADNNDPRLTSVLNEGQDIKAETAQTYDNMIEQSDSFYKELIDVTQQKADKQAQIQQENTDFLISTINQQKEQEHEDYLKEQSGAYVDWQKQSNPYGVNAEKMAAAGLAGSGYSESSQVSMYNTYQNRVATARETYKRAVLNFDNSIKEAILQNNAALAEIAFTALEKQLTLGLEGFQYKNQLILDKTNKLLEIDNNYWGRYTDILNQINTEKALAEDIRQFDEGLKHDKEMAEIEHNYNLERDRINNEFTAEQAKLDRQHDMDLQAAKTEDEKELADYNYNLAIKKLKEEHKNELEILDKQYSYKSSTSGGNAKITSSNTNNSNSKFSSLITGNNKKVNTAYYSGSLNSDAKKYGTFSNGYQPKGISGYGEVSKTGDTITFTTYTLSGQKQTVTQNIWKTNDGTKWYWDGRYNKYIKCK